MDKEKQIRNWCAGIKTGNKEAFNACFKTFFPALTMFASRYLNDRDEAMDVVQDTFVKLWNKRSELDESRSLKSLLYTMVRNQCLNHLRDVTHKLTLIEHTELDEFQHEVEQKAFPDEYKKALKTLIDGLPDRQKECIELSRFDGLSHEEIAEVLNLSSRTVNNHIVTALKSLKIKFEQYKESTMVL